MRNRKYRRVYPTVNLHLGVTVPSVEDYFAKAEALMQVAFEEAIEAINL